MSKRMQQFLKFVCHFLISTFMVCLCICAGSARIRYCCVFYLTCCNSSLFPHLSFELATLSRGVRLLRRKKHRNPWIVALFGTRTRKKMAHFFELRRTCMEVGALSQITAHLRERKRTWLGEKRHTLRRVFKCGYGIFVAFFLMRTVTIIYFCYNILIAVFVSHTCVCYSLQD